MEAYRYEPADDYLRDIQRAINDSVAPNAALGFAEARYAIGPAGRVTLLVFTLEVDQGSFDDAFAMLLYGMTIGLDAQPEVGLDGQGFVIHGPRSTTALAPYGYLGESTVLLMAMGDPDGPVEEVTLLILGDE